MRGLVRISEKLRGAAAGILVEAGVLARDRFLLGLGAWQRSDAYNDESEMSSRGCGIRRRRG